MNITVPVSLYICCIYIYIYICKKYTSDGKSSYCLWQGELKRVITRILSVARSCNMIFGSSQHQCNIPIITIPQNIWLHMLETACIKSLQLTCKQSHPKKFISIKNVHKSWIIILCTNLIHQRKFTLKKVIFVYVTYILYINKCGHRNVLSKRQVWLSIFHIINLKKKEKKIMDTGVLDFFNKIRILDYYFCLKSGPVFLFQIFIIDPLPLPRDIKLYH